MFELADIFPDQDCLPPEEVPLITYVIQDCLELTRGDLGLTTSINDSLFSLDETRILAALARGHQVGLPGVLGKNPRAFGQQMAYIREKLKWIPLEILDGSDPTIYSVGSRANYIATANPLPEGDQFIPGLMTLDDEQRLWNTEQPPAAKVLTHALCTQAEVKGTEITPEILPCQREMLLALLAAAGQPLTGPEIAANIGYSPTIIGPQMLSLRDVVSQYSYEGAQLMLPSSSTGYYLYLKVV